MSDLASVFTAVNARSNRAPPVAAVYDRSTPNGRSS
jgi:hypothetical protein